MNNDIIINNITPQQITISGGGEVYGIIAVYVNGINVTDGDTAYIIVPTKTSELTNDSGYISNETDPTVPSVVKTITAFDISNWNSKQNQLISGSTIKTINNTSLLGSGNINVGGIEYEAGTGIDINANTIINTITSYNDLTDLPVVPDSTSQLINDSDFVSSDQLADVAFTGSYLDLTDDPVIPQNTSDLVNDSDFAYTDQYNAFLADQDITGNLTVSGTIDYKKYTNTEQFIGYWINNKILCQKSFAITLPNNTTGSISTGFTTEKVKNIYGTVTDGVRVYPINYKDQTTSNEINTYYENSYINFQTNFDGSSYTGYVTLEYTKD